MNDNDFFESEEFGSSPVYLEPITPVVAEDAVAPEFSGGEDWFEFTGRIHYRDWELVNRTLGEKQTAVQTGYLEDAVLDGGDAMVTVDAFGAKLGGKAAFHAPYVLRSEGLFLALMPYGIEKSIGWNYKATFPSLPLIQAGLHGCLDHWLKMVGMLGAEVELSTVSRVDLAVDFPNLQVQPFVQAHRERRYTGKKRGGGEVYNCTREHDDNGSETGVTAWDEQDTGFRLLAGVIVRIYDKLREMQSRRDEQKIAAMQQNRFGGTKPEHATRVEFQLRANFLRSVEVRSIVDWLERRADVARYLTEEYLRIADGPIDRKNQHQSRSGTSELWQKVQRAFREIYGEGQNIQRVYRKGDPDVTMLHKQLVGCLLSSAAKRGVRLDSKAAAIRELEFALANYGNDRLDSESLRRVIKLYRGTGFGIGDNLAG